MVDEKRTGGGIRRKRTRVNIVIIIPCFKPLRTRPEVCSGFESARLNFIRNVNRVAHELAYLAFSLC